MKLRLLVGFGLAGLALTTTAPAADRAQETEVSIAIEEPASTLGRSSAQRGSSGHVARRRPRLTPLARAIVHRVVRTNAARRLLDVALKDDETLAWTMWHLCDRLVLETSLEGSLPARDDQIR